MSNELFAQREFLNRYYKHVRHFYDFTRKFYLLGRDEVIRQLLLDPWQKLIEIGPGTGRNLIKLKNARPHAQFGGIEASDEMLITCRRKCPWATLKQGYAESTDLTEVLSGAPDRILFSYSISMIQDKEMAIRNAMNALSDHGEVIIVDFGDFNGFPDWLRSTFKKFLIQFHVSSVNLSDFLPRVKQPQVGPLGYYIIGRLKKSN